ncbi:BldC family transcriptional regulator [Streptosporangium sp. NPDC051022]|uniref:BldC family transcriptional regulator n=1 Tax=Streptosporangium sp. NPDC051022 TaxID=3155752 RepID=UPI00344583B3
MAPATEALLTPTEVAVLFRVDPKTVARWARTGKLTPVRTIEGHRCYKETEVRALLTGEHPTPAPDTQNHPHPPSPGL